jgi:hypothetical protein
LDHVVYVDHNARELEKLISGDKTIVIRGATGRKLPYGRVFEGDLLYFIRNNGEGLVRAKAVVKHVLNSEKMTKEESMKLVMKMQRNLNLPINSTKSGRVNVTLC